MVYQFDRMTNGRGIRTLGTSHWSMMYGTFFLELEHLQNEECPIMQLASYLNEQLKLPRM